MSDRIAPIHTGDRQIDQLGRETRLECARADSRLTALETLSDRLMPLDGLEYLYWPCDDASGSTIIRNASATPSGHLVPPSSAAGVISESQGFVASGALRLWTGTNANRGAVGAAALVPSTSAVSLSCWARLGIISAADIIGYWESGGSPIFALSVNSGLPRGTVQNVAGTQTIDATSDCTIAAGEWHHYLVTYNGQLAQIYVDGNFTSQGPAATSAINWTFGAATRQWKIGLPGSANSMFGSVQDIRVHSCQRPYAWAKESYERGIGTFREAA